MNDSGTIEQRIKGQRRRKRIFAVGVATMICWVGVTWYDQQATLADKQIELKKVQEQFEEYKLKNNDLSYQVEKLHDLEYIAEIARKNYHLSKPGEVIFIIPE
jgi:cell division protein DivIC